MTWAEMFPDGRQIFYEGDKPKAFAKEIKQRVRALTRVRTIQAGTKNADIRRVSRRTWSDLRRRRISNGVVSLTPGEQVI